MTTRTLASTRTEEIGGCFTRYKITQSRSRLYATVMTLTYWDGDRDEVDRVPVADLTEARAHFARYHLDQSFFASDDAEECIATAYDILDQEDPAVDLRCWRKDGDGDNGVFLFTESVYGRAYELRPEVAMWLNQNMPGRWGWRNNRKPIMTFADDRYATLFKLRWWPL